MFQNLPIQTVTTLCVLIQSLGGPLDGPLNIFISVFPTYSFEYNFIFLPESFWISVIFVICLPLSEMMRIDSRNTLQRARHFCIWRFQYFVITQMRQNSASQTVLSCILWMGVN